MHKIISAHKERFPDMGDLLGRQDGEGKRV